MAGIIQDQAYFDQEVAPHLDDQIRYIGAAGPAERDRLLGGAAALLHLINFAEPFGLSMVEAMACGTPVIATRRGSVPEIVVHGATGWIVDGVDEAVTALEALGTLDRQAIRAHVAANFSHKHMVGSYLDLYHTIVERQHTIRATA
jgi:glycosyltransferase involved in cell wall biosynthesis